MAGRFVSPNEMMAAAKEMTLDGREPESRHDWCLVFNFLALNTADGMEVAACKLMAMIYSAPLSPEDVEKIANFQALRKVAAKN